MLKKMSTKARRYGSSFRWGRTVSGLYRILYRGTFYLPTCCKVAIREGAVGY